MILSFILSLIAIFSPMAITASAENVSHETVLYMANPPPEPEEVIPLIDYNFNRTFQNFVYDNRTMSTTGYSFPLPYITPNDVESVNYLDIHIDTYTTANYYLYITIPSFTALYQPEVTTGFGKTPVTLYDTYDEATDCLIFTPDSFRSYPQLHIRFPYEETVDYGFDPEDDESTAYINIRMYNPTSNYNRFNIYYNNTYFPNIAPVLYSYGYGDGYDYGEQVGYYNGYQIGLDVDSEEAYIEGYNRGLSEQMTNPISGILSQGFEALNVPIIGSISLADVIYTIITIAFILVFLRLFAGG